MAQKKLETVEDKLTEALRPVLGGQLLPLQKAGKNPGIFPAGATGKKLADEAINRGLVHEGEPVAPAKKGGKPKPQYRITPKGLQFVLDRDSPKEALNALQVALREMTAQLPGKQETTFPLEELRESLNSQYQQFQAALTQAAADSDKRIQERNQKIDRLTGTIQAVEKAVERASKQPAIPVPSPTPPKESPMSGSNAWTKEIEQFLVTRRENGTVGDCTLPELFTFLRQREPELSIGHYHDALRKLHTEDRIRLSGWSGPLENLPQPNLAMFIAHKVMYYARLP